MVADHLAPHVLTSWTEDQLKVLAKHLAPHVLKSRKFWGLLLCALGSAGLTLWGYVGYYVKERTTTLFNQEVTNQIRLQFQEPRISNIVVAVALEQATNLMVQQIQPAIDKKLRPRSLIPEQQTHLIASLASAAEKPLIVVLASFLDTEATDYAEQVANVFTKAGFKVHRPTGMAPDSILAGEPPGIHIAVRDATKPQPQAAYIQRCFLNEGIQMMGLSSGDPNYATNSIQIIIGQK